MSGCFRRIAWTGALLLGGLLVTLPVQAASFDCAKATSKVEHMICDDPEISKLDEELARSYKVALQDQSRAELIKLAQKQWMKERNTCRDMDCLSAAYQARIQELSASSKPESEMPAFSLLKGKGVPVCEAYLKRLNMTEWDYYEKLPTCGRPENDSVEGFTKLNRVPLSAEQIAALYGETFNFSTTGHSDRGNVKPSDPKPTERAKQSMDSGGLKVWRYDPPVDIDNDGKPDADVIVWHGDVVGGGPCGRRAGWADSVQSYQTLIYSIDWQQMKLNDGRTRELFGHPVGGYPIIFQGKKVMADGFRPLGWEMGIFAFQGQYYLDTFFNAWGDFEGKRRSNAGDGKHRQKNDLDDILGVFQRKNGVTKQICEYRWNEFEKYYR